MERLAASLPQPVIVTAQNDSTQKDTTYLDAKPVKQAQSLIRMLDSCEQSKTPYRKRFAGSLLLSVQYRMHPSISAFSSAIFYDSLLSTPAYLAGFRQFPEKLTSSLPVDATSHNVRFVNVGGRSNELRGSSNLKFSREGALAEGGTSYSNQLEAARVVELLKELIASEEHGAQSIGVVTPYSGQVQLIMELMKKDEDYIRLASELGEAIEVKSVDGYQGRERDVIIFSAVRSNRSGSLGFLTDWRRMNVALTRSKIALIVVGDLETLEAGDKHWAAFAKWCHASKCIVSS
jgi:regulator of nonsense transcripts 1